MIQPPAHSDGCLQQVDVYTYYTDTQVTRSTVNNVAVWV